jgi:hypothetical protein
MNLDTLKNAPPLELEIVAQAPTVLDPRVPELARKDICSRGPSFGLGHDYNSAQRSRIFHPS